MLDYEVHRFINDPTRIEIVRAMMYAGEAIDNRWHLYGDVYLTAQAYDTLYDGDLCPSTVITILEAKFDEKGKTRPNAGRFILCEYAANDVGGELILGGFSRVNFYSAQNRLKGIFTPSPVKTDISMFVADDDARAILTLKLMAIRA